MKLLQCFQYISTALAIFIVFYFSYVITVGIGMFMLPVFFVMAATAVLLTVLSKNNQE